MGDVYGFWGVTLINLGTQCFDTGASTGNRQDSSPDEQAGDPSQIPRVGKGCSPPPVGKDWPEDGEMSELGTMVSGEAG